MSFQESRECDDHFLPARRVVVDLYRHPGPAQCEPEGVAQGRILGLGDAHDGDLQGRLRAGSAKKTTRDARFREWENAWWCSIRKMQVGVVTWKSTSFSLASHHCSREV